MIVWPCARRGEQPCLSCRKPYFQAVTSLTISIPPELKSRLKAEARRMRTSCAAIVRDSVRVHLKRKDRGKLSLYERTKHLCGIGDSGVKDLATNPKYLKGLGEGRK